MNYIFSALSAVFSLYALICFVRIMLSWFPGAEYSSFGRILAQLCDPYLNRFRRFSFLRFSAFDFTPAIALCILIAASTIFSGFSTGNAFRLGSLLAMLISMCWSIASSILTFLAIILIVRLVIYFLKKGNGSYYSIWDSVDRAVTPIIYRITSLFTKGTLPFHKALILSIVIIIAFSVLGRVLIGFICSALLMLPF